MMAVANAMELPGVMARAAESSKAGAGATNVAPKSMAGRPAEPKEQAAVPETSEGVVERVVRPLSPQVVPPAAEEEDEVEEIVREESQPQAVRILYKRGMKWWSWKRRTPPGR